MRFSIYLNPQTRGAHEDVEIIETIERQAVTATQAGFDGIALTEHHFSGYNTYGNNFMMAAHLAPQVRPGTRFQLAVAVPALHNPLRLAQMCNLLDVLCRGNVTIGFAAGGSPLEYAGMGRDPSVRHEQMLHNLQVMERALDKRPEDPPYEWETAFEAGSLRTRIMPAAYYRDRPPFARATQSDEGVVWTARKGWYLFTARLALADMTERFALYRSELEAAGFDEETVEDRLGWSFAQKQIYLADTDGEAERSMRQRMRGMAENQKKSFAMTGDLTDAKSMKSVVGVSPSDPDEFLEKAMILGSPATVRATLEAYAEAGVRHVALLFNFGFMTAAESDRSLNLFLEEVLPHLAQTPVAVSGAARV